MDGGARPIIGLFFFENGPVPFFKDLWTFFTAYTGYISRYIFISRIIFGLQYLLVPNT